jgi:chromosome segregation ATPase
VGMISNYLIKAQQKSKFDQDQLKAEVEALKKKHRADSENWKQDSEKKSEELAKANGEVARLISLIKEKTKEFNFQISTYQKHYETKLKDAFHELKIRSEQKEIEASAEVQRVTSESKNQVALVIAEKERIQYFLQEKLKSLSREYTTQSQELTSKNQMITALQNGLTERSQEIERLKIEEARRQSHSGIQEQFVENLKSQYEARLKHEAEAYERLNNELKELRIIHQDTTREHGQNLNQIKFNSEEIHTLRDKVNEYEIQLNGSNSKVQSLTMELETVRREFSQMQSELTEKIRSLVVDQEIERRKLVENFQTEHSTRLRIQSELNQIQEKVGNELNAIQQKNLQLEIENQFLGIDRNELRKNLERVKAVLSQSNKPPRTQ